MSMFEKGQTIRAIRAAQSAYGHKFAPGDEVVVTNPDMFGRPESHPHHRLGVNSRQGVAETGGDSSEWVVNPSDFEAVPEWSDIEVGDGVTLRLKATGEEFEHTAYLEAGSASARVLGLSTAGLARSKFELLAIRKPEKPKPQVPITPGSVVLIHSGSPAWPNGLALIRGTEVWRGGRNQLWSDTDVAYANGGHFEVLHDAGKDA